MTNGIYLPDGSFKRFDGGNVILQKSKQEVLNEPQDVDFTPDEFEVFQTIIRYMQWKYANKKMEEVFPKMEKDMIAAFEKIGLLVEVAPIANPDTQKQVEYINYCKQYGYMPIEVRVIRRIGDFDGTRHERELYAWKHRKEGKKGFKKIHFDK